MVLFYANLVYFATMVVKYVAFACKHLCVTKLLNMTGRTIFSAEWKYAAWIINRTIKRASRVSTSRQHILLMGCINLNSKLILKYLGNHYNDVIMAAIASPITSLTIVYSVTYSGADQRKHQSSASLAFVRGIHRWPVNSPHKLPVTREMFPSHDVTMIRQVSSQYTTVSTKAISVWNMYLLQ